MKFVAKIADAVSTTTVIVIAIIVGAILWTVAVSAPLTQIHRDLLSALGLLVVSIGYNAFVSWLEARDFEEGYTALLVVGGVGYTILSAIPAIGVDNFLELLWRFAATGAPMVCGSWARHVRQRARERQQIRREVKDGF